MPVTLFWRTTMNDCFWVITLTHIKPMFHSRRNQSIDPDCISIDCGFYMTLTLAWCGLRMLQFLHSNAFRSSHCRCFIKKVFLKMSQNSQKNACARASFIIKLEVFLVEHLWMNASVLRWDQEDFICLEVLRIFIHLFRFNRNDHLVELVFSDASLWNQYRFIRLLTFSCAEF